MCCLFDAASSAGNQRDVQQGDHYATSDTSFSAIFHRSESDGGVASCRSGTERYAQSQPGTPGLSDQMPDVSDKKLDAAAAAIKQITSVKEDYGQRIEAAEPAEKERIAGEAKTAMTKAVTDQGFRCRSTARFC